MTILDVVTVLNKALEDGSIRPDYEIIAATFNRCLTEDEAQLAKYAEEEHRDGLYLLMSDKDDEVYNTALCIREKEETEE